MFEISLPRSSIHCGNNPRMVKAEPEDLVIVCGDVSVEVESQQNSLENEVNSIVYFLRLMLYFIIFCLFSNSLWGKAPIFCKSNSL